MARKTPIRHDPAVESFAGKLREIRRSRGMTQKDLARQAHVTESYLSRLESAQIAPGIDLVARLARALQSPLTELLAHDETPAHTIDLLDEQAKKLFDVVLRARDRSYLLLLNQFLALLAEAVERQH
jgi:transcriptional regulator with XRE-family HTH domain